MFGKGYWRCRSELYERDRRLLLVCVCGGGWVDIGVYRGGWVDIGVCGGGWVDIGEKK